HVGVPAPSVIARGVLMGAVVSVAAALDSVRYSARSATMGSTPAARRAGVYLAASATAISPSADATDVNGSVGFTPNSSTANTRLVAYAAGSPIATPAAAIARPSPWR